MVAFRWPYRPQRGILEMLRLSIETSKSGRIWPTGYWKPLIDSLCRSGARKDPRAIYRDLSFHLKPLICEREGRFYPTSASPLVPSDDTAISFIQVALVRPGDEAIRFPPPKIPDASLWPSFEFPYFGTIGNSKYEEQTKQNRLVLAERQHELFDAQFTPITIWLHFQLSTSRRDRDLDNLADALMPFFNKLLPRLTVVRLSKTASRAQESEVFGVSTRIRLLHNQGNGLSPN